MARPKGFKHSKETLEKMRLAQLGAKNHRFGKKNSEEWHSKMDGKTSWNKGKKLTEDHKRKLSNAKIGKHISPDTEFKKCVNPWNKNKPWDANRGCNHWNWQGGKTKRGKHTTQLFEYKEWRMSVFIRDNFTCKNCNSTKIYIEAHHIKSWVHHSELRYDINNGITLCKECHKLTNNYKGKSKKSF